MSWAISVGLELPARDSDHGPPDPIEPEYDLEGPAFYATYDDGEKGDNVLFPLLVDNILTSHQMKEIKDTVKQHGSVAIEHGWRWRLKGDEWVFAPTEEIAEENACEAYMERIEDDCHDI